MNVLLGVTWLWLATTLGGVPIFFTKEVNERVNSLLMGIAAGIMLAASFFSLLLPAIEEGGTWVALAGFISGGAFLLILESAIPHFHALKGLEGGATSNLNTRSLKKLWLFILAIAIHNLPEGLSVGVGFASGNFKEALGLALGIGIQDIPEGFAVAAPLVTYGYSKFKAFLIASITGFLEVITGLLGYVALTLAKGFLPLALAFSAGAMIGVISKEVIPESHSGGNDRIATIGLFIGFSIMMILDVLLG